MKAVPPFRLQSQLLLFASSVLISLFPTGWAKSEVVLSNLDTGTFQPGSRLNLNRAVSFETNSSSWNITNFSFAAYNPTSPTSSDFTIRLYAASATGSFSPIGTALYSSSLTGVTIPVGLANSAIVSFNTSNWIVEANTKYAIEVSLDSGLKTPLWARTDGNFSPQSWNHLSDLVFANGGLTDDGVSPLTPLVYSISATAVPEPSTIVTFSLCIIGVLIWRFIGIAR